MRPPAARVRIDRRGEDDAGHAVGVHRTFQDRDAAPHRVSGKHDGSLSRLAQEACEPPSEIHQPGGPPGAGGSPEAGEIGSQHPPQSGEARRHLEPAEVGAPESVEQHERGLRRAVPLAIRDRAVHVDRFRAGAARASSRGGGYVGGRTCVPVSPKGNMARTWLFGKLVNRFTRPPHALSFTFRGGPPIPWVAERRRRLRNGDPRTLAPFENESTERPRVPEDRRAALRPSGFEEEDDTKCRIRLVP